MRARVHAIAILLAWTLSSGIRSSEAEGPATLENLLDVDREPQRKSLVAPATVRLPVPSDDDVAAAVDLIRQAYEEEYAEASRSPRRLIDTLTQAVEKVEDVTRRYALLVEAERAAIDAGDVEAAIEAASLRSQQFQVDPAKCRLEVLLSAARNDRRDDAELCRMFVDLADQAMGCGQLDVADKAASEAIAMAKRVERSDRVVAAEQRKRTGRKPTGNGKAPALMEQATDMQRQLKDRRKAMAQYEAALGKLEEHPDDAAANGVVGRYRCFVAGDWRDGLQSLVAGDSESMATVASDEIQMRKEPRRTPERLMAVAGAWWKLADSEGVTSAEAEAIKRHAATMYQEALPDITDPIERALAEKRVAAMKLETDGFFVQDTDAAWQTPDRRSDASVEVPASVLLPVPADLSLELVPLLPTEAEVETLQNHVDRATRQVENAKEAFLQRVYAEFPVARWTATDAAYLIALNDSLNELLGESTALLPALSMGGSREACKAAMASVWVLESKDEQEFARRIRSLPTDLVQLEQVGWRINERSVREWFKQLGPEYSATRRQLRAIEYLIDQEVASEGMRRYAKELSETVEQP